MERHLGKRFEDERLRRLITGLTDIEQLRTVALRLLEYKISQEAGFYKVMCGWDRLTPAQVDAALEASRRPFDSTEQAS